MPGKATRPDDGRRKNIGGKRPGAGRPKGSTSPRGARGIHQIRAYDDEWELIRQFQRLTRIDIEQSRLAINMLAANLKQGDLKAAALIGG